MVPGLFLCNRWQPYLLYQSDTDDVAGYEAGESVMVLEYDNVIFTVIEVAGRVIGIHDQIAIRGCQICRPTRRHSLTKHWLPL